MMTATLWWWLLWRQPVPLTVGSTTVDSVALQVAPGHALEVRCAGHPDGPRHVWKFDANYDLVTEQPPASGIMAPTEYRPMQEAR